MPAFCSFPVRIMLVFQAVFYVLHYKSLYHCIIIEDAFICLEVIFNVMVYISALCISITVPEDIIFITLFLNSCTVSVTFAKCQKCNFWIENYQSEILNFLFEI